jgi:XTP/dITP diphosphohydrolase
MTRLVLATRNRKKLVELDRILRDAGVSVDLLTLDDVEVPEVVESGATFAENAIIKATATAAATGLVSVADDSGLAVDALNGMPGVLSARWSGIGASDESNLALVLEQIADVPDDRRGASFVCVAALAEPSGEVHTVEGRVVGHLLRQPVGTGGFGYDPIFVPEGHDLTTAQMEPAHKDALSHRGQALRGIAALLGAGGGTRTRTPEGTGS